MSLTFVIIFYSPKEHIVTEAEEVPVESSQAYHRIETLPSQDAAQSQQEVESKNWRTQIMLGHSLVFFNLATFYFLPISYVYLYIPLERDVNHVESNSFIIYQ